MKMDAKFEAKNETFGASFEQTDSTFDADFSNVGGGQDGKDGVTFIPFVSQEGVISWTNNGNLPNPAPVNIKGAKGDKGDRGERGERGLQGVQGERGADGARGEKGIDGIPATHKWSGTTLYITSASGTSSANLKGDKGDKGDAGANGKDGYTPVRGKDYLTYTDKQEMVNAVISALPKYNGEVAAE